MAPSSHADCEPWASGTNRLHRLTLAEWLCRTTDRIDPARAFGSHYCLGRGTSAPEVNFVCRLLQLRQNASVFAQGCADFPSDSSDRNHSFTTHPWRTSSSLRPGLSFRLRFGIGRMMILLTIAIDCVAVAMNVRSWTCEGFEQRNAIVLRHVSSFFRQQRISG